jgi:hypothetical protein
MKGRQWRYVRKTEVQSPPEQPKIYAQIDKYEGSGDIGDILRLSREDALEILGCGSEGTELPL